MANLNTEFSRGSIWRRWDLHVHTPMSLQHHYGENNETTWEKYIKDLENLPEEISVLGINDYIFLDGYRKVVDFQKKGRLKNIRLILPVVELRIDKFGTLGDAAWKRVNFHIIFSNKLNPDIIEQQFLNAIQHSHKLSHESSIYDFSGIINRESLSDLGKKIKSSSTVTISASDSIVGFNNITYSYDKIKEALKSSYFINQFITAIGKTEWDALRWDGSITDKKTIINEANLVFTSAASPENFLKAKEKLKRECVNSNLVDCSDAHSFSDEVDSNGNLIKDRIGKSFSWFKTDPTFEGLQHILYEPEERVMIQVNNPFENFPKPSFSNIEIEPTKIFADETSISFEKNTIQLNPNLIAIIGGRGTGKSLLLDTIAKTFNKSGNNDRAKKVSVSENHFKITYNKEDNSPINYSFGNENNLDYLHIHQGEVKNISDPNNLEILDQEIKNLLKIPPYDQGSNTYSDSQIERLINEIFEIREWLDYIDSDGHKSNTTKYNENKKKENEDLIQTITTEKNKELIDQYINNLRKSEVFQQNEIIGNKLNEDLISFQNEKNSSIIEVNNSIPDTLKKIPIINFEAQIEPLSIFLQTMKNELDIIDKSNAEIEKDFKEKGIVGNISSLLEKIEIYQKDINNYSSRIIEIKEKEKDLNLKFQAIGDIVNSIINNNENYKQKITEEWDALKKGKMDWNADQQEVIKRLLADIEISSEEVFNSKSFYATIKDSLNGQKFRTRVGQLKEDRISETFKLNTKSDFISFLKGNIAIETDEGNYKIYELFDSNIFNRDGIRDFFRQCLLTVNREKYWKVFSNSTYKGKDTSKLSVGQRGTFYLCLKLATDPFGKPFIFDQPEDDLDNDFIMHELVPLFKKIKVYRQVIIVTHNANLVVNADAEQVIVSQNNAEKLAYISGSIENSMIRNHICNILEGGKAAFMNREKKYGF